MLNWNIYLEYYLYCNDFIRKEKRHRDGSKKKKKDKDRDKDKNSEKGEKRRKKHHHSSSYWDAQPHQSSEMLAPLRLKVRD